MRLFCLKSSCLAFLVAGFSVFLLCGCSSKRSLLTQQIIASGISFTQIPGGEIGFDHYVSGPKYKAFAVAMYPNGIVHAWGKA